jgi:hypothetical protein
MINKKEEIKDQIRKQKEKTRMKVALYLGR